MVDRSASVIKLGSWDFHPIGLADIDMYAEFIKATEYPANLWSSNFAYLWASSQSRLRKVLWREIDGMLVTFGHSHKNSLYLFCLPFGAGDSQKLTKVMTQCMQYCLEWNKRENDRTLVRMINQHQLEYLRECPEFDLTYRPVTLKGIERHFAVKKLVALSGKDFGNIRNRINKFNRENRNVVIRRYRPDDYQSVMELGRQWSAQAGQKYPVIFDQVYYPAIIERSAELKQLVLVMESGKQIIGLIAGGELPTGQAWGSLLKYLDRLPGLSETLTVEFARELNRINPAVELLNVGSDLGQGGLRDYKLKFRPVLNLKRYQLYLK